MASTRTLPSGKTQTWSETVRACTDPGELVMGYWGLGIVERAGCRYKAEKVSSTEYKIVSECMVRRAARAVSEAFVTLKEADTFTVRVTVTEGKRRYAATQSAHRLAACPE